MSHTAFTALTALTAHSAHSAIAPTPPVPAILLLASRDSEVGLCMTGGALSHFSWRGQSVLRAAQASAVAAGAVRHMAMYPLVPYSNRIGDALLKTGGTAFRLRANMPPEPHAIHGFGWQRQWRLVARDAARAEIMLVHAGDADWPFACAVRQCVRLVDDVLEVSLAVRNTDLRPMPAGLGFHPYFPLAPGVRLQTSWQQMWQMGIDCLPIRLAAVPPSAIFTAPRPLEHWKVDHCFTGWSRSAVLYYAHHAVRLDASAACRNIVCFAPDDGRDFIALEPVTHVNNAFAMAADGVNETGTVILAPGEELSISMTIAVHETTAGHD